MSKTPKYTIVSAMKNEGPYILEWIAHHMALGVEHFIVVTNDCDDGTDRMLERLEQLGHVTHVVNPKVANRDVGRWQRTAFNYVQHINIYKDSEWIMHSDVDEFICLKSGLKSLDDLINHFEQVDLISFTSTAFNSNGLNQLRDVSILGQFTQRERFGAEIEGQLNYNGKPKARISAVKTLFRNKIKFGSRNNHRPFHMSFSKAGHVWRDGSGNVLEPEFTDGRIKTLDSFTTVELAQLNHYAVKSIEAFIVKVDRGDVATDARLGNSEHYFKNYDTFGKPDKEHSKLSADARKLLQAFKRDPVLSKLHKDAFAWHANRFQELLVLGDYFTLAVRLGYLDSDRTLKFRAPARSGKPAGPKIKSAKAIAEKACKALNKPLPKISSMWIGDKMSYVEIAVMQSFLDNGHEFTLYTLDDVGKVPDGVNIVDAREIYAPEFPTGPDMRHNNAVYADIFRLIMIRDTGAIWADMDAYCVRPFVFPTEYVFGYQESKPSIFDIANGVLGFPKDSEALTKSIELVLSHNPIPAFFNHGRRERLRLRSENGDTFGFQDFSWGTSGPRLIDYYLNQTDELKYAMPKNVLYPGPRPFKYPLLKPDFPIDQLEFDETVSVHIFGKTKTFINTDFGGVLPKGCYLDTICKRHGVDPAEFPIPV